MSDKSYSTGYPLPVKGTEETTWGLYENGARDMMRAFANDFGIPPPDGVAWRDYDLKGAEGRAILAEKIRERILNPNTERLKRKSPGKVDYACERGSTPFVVIAAFPFGDEMRELEVRFAAMDLAEWWVERPPRGCEVRSGVQYRPEKWAGAAKGEGE